jgi:hypothetical protein
MIKLRFTYNPTWYNRAIRAYTWYPYTHVDYCMDDGSYISAIPGKGVIQHTLSAKTEQFLFIDADKPIVEHYLKQEIGKPYDWWGIFGIATHRNWQEPDKWFCSELIAYAINKSKPFFYINSNKITPRDVALVCRSDLNK